MLTETHRKASALCNLFFYDYCSSQIRLRAFLYAELYKNPKKTIEFPQKPNHKQDCLLVVVFHYKRLLIYFLRDCIWRLIYGK